MSYRANSRTDLSDDDVLPRRTRYENFEYLCVRCQMYIERTEDLGCMWVTARGIMGNSPVHIPPTHEQAAFWLETISGVNESWWGGGVRKEGSYAPGDDNRYGDDAGDGDAEESSVATESAYRDPRPRYPSG